MKRPSGNLWLDTFFARQSTDIISNHNLTGKTIIFTGGTDGMGRIAVERFASMGANICLLARNAEKAANIISNLKNNGYSGDLSTVMCDLSSLSDVHQAANIILDKYTSIHFLINCAGANIRERRLSPEGYELNFVINYLSPFLLTERLLERIKATPNSRILNVTSATQQLGHLDLNDLHREKKWSLFSTYAQAKLCMIMHSENLADRLQENDTIINCLNPGYIQTNLLRDLKGFERLFNIMFGHLAAPAWVGGERIVAAILDEKYNKVSGKFIYEDRIMAPNPETKDYEKVQKLLNLSFAMTNLH